MLSQFQLDNSPIYFDWFSQRKTTSCSYAADSVKLVMILRYVSLWYLVQVY